jgi:aspartate kinase
VAVSITIDSEEKLEEITTDLEAFGVIAVQKNQTIVTIVGNEIMQTNEMMRRLFNAINEIPVSMVSYGGSKHNVSLLIPAEFKAITLKALNKGLFDL